MLRQAKTLTSIKKSKVPKVSSRGSSNGARQFSQTSTTFRVPSFSGSFAPLRPAQYTKTSVFPTFSVNIQRPRFASKTVKVPGMGDSITEGRIQQWHKQIGELANVDDLVVSIETDKVVVEIRAPETGVITEHCAAPETMVAVGTDLFKIDPDAKPAGGAAPPKPKAEQPKKADQPTAAPQAAQQAPQQTAAPTKPAEAPKPAPTPSTPVAPSSRTEVRQKMSLMRLRIAERLKGAQNTYAMLTTFNEIDMSGITNLRNTYKEEFEKKHGVKLGFMSAFIKATTAALQEQPMVNAVVDGNEIVYRNYFDVSVAVATPTGLVVPVLRDADKLSFAGVEKSLAELGKKARDGKLAMEDMVGGTFTISNGGVYGSMMGTPIINPPQSAILGMHAVKNRVVAVGDKIEIRPMMYVALTYDHRLIDGREAVTFLKKIKETVEDPRRLLLEL